MNDRSPFVSRVLFPVTVMFALSTVGALGSAADAPTSAPTIVVPYGASEYKYQVVPVHDGIEFERPVGTTDVVVYVAVDNDVQVFINGYDISDGLQTHEGCPSLNSFSFAVP